MGGTSNQEYQYDDFYRLKSAKATYQGEFTKASYELNMSYNKMHNITKKDLVHTVNNEQKGYVLDYNYDNELHPNAPNKIAETGKAIPRKYETIQPARHSIKLLLFIYLYGIIQS